jgi:hypothetical protein
MSNDSLHGSLTKSVDDMPWWAKLTLLVGLTFGVPTAILMFYLAQDAGVIGNPVAKSLEEVKGLIIQHEAAEQRRQVRRCVLGAKTEDERRACFPQ